jgi:beta-glucanase (GH16 family)
MILILACFRCTPARANPPAGYELVWADEFNKPSLDTKKWDYWLLGLRRDAFNVTNAVSLDGSNLVITTYSDKGTHYSGFISTSSTFRPHFGYLEARIQWGDTNGTWSAFWLQSPTMGRDHGNPSASGSEIDIAEHRYVDDKGKLINDQIQPNLHWNGYGQDSKSVGGNNYGNGLGSGFHIYGLLWTPEYYSISIDGTEVRKWNFADNHVPISNSPEFFILSTEVDATSTKWAGSIPADGYRSLSNSTTKMRVDYVRYYASINQSVPAIPK